MPQDENMTNTALDLPAGMFRSGDRVEETTLRMQRKNYGLQNVDVKFNDLDGLAVFEGDIVLGDTEQVRGVGDPVPLGGRGRALHHR